MAIVAVVAGSGRDGSVGRAHRPAEAVAIRDGGGAAAAAARERAVVWRRRTQRRSLRVNQRALRGGLPSCRAAARVSTSGRRASLARRLLLLAVLAYRLVRRRRCAAGQASVTCGRATWRRAVNARSVRQLLPGSSGQLLGCRPAVRKVLLGIHRTCAVNWLLRHCTRCRHRWVPHRQRSLRSSRRRLRVACRSVRQPLLLRRRLLPRHPRACR
mmetsp:Transcript_5957/g.18355  ORF Transcript_5957/g.18355 Transcript_5957/m.18355 type:complete len:214 (+) Transcript_5957:207-848(+)